MKHFNRIQTTREFDAIYRRADKTWHTPWFVLFYKRSTECHVGFVASKKVGNAVHRNRAKRLLRAQFIQLSDSTKEGSYILVAKPPLLETDYKKITKAYRDALKKCKALGLGLPIIK